MVLPSTVCLNSVSNSPQDPSNSKHLCIGQMNVAHIRKDLSDLYDFKDSNGRPKFDILLITEPPHTVKGNKIFVPDQDTKVFYVKDPSPNKWITSAAVYVLNNKIKWRPIILTSTPILAEIEIICENMKIRLAAAYVHPRRNNLTQLNMLKDHASQGKTHLIAGDLNARHDHWECRGVENNNGRALFKFTQLNNWTILNSAGEFTRRPLTTSQAPTAPDITMSHAHSAHLVSNWKVEQSHFLSDHLCISFNIKFSFPPRQWVFKAASNHKVASKMVNALSQLRPSDITYENILETFRKTKKSLVAKAPNTVKNSTCQENKKIWRLRSTINKISRTLKANPKCHLLNSPTEHGLGTEIMNLSKLLKEKRCQLINWKIKEIRKLRNRGLAKRVKKFGQSIIWKEFDITGKSSNGPNIIKTLDGSIITDQTEIIKLIMSDLNSKQLQEQFFPPPPSKPFRDHNLTLHEVNLAISLLKSNKACGTDEISAKLLKNIHTSDPNILHNFVNHLWKTKTIPAPLKQSRLVILSKANESIASLTSYRPIGIPNQPLKVLELVILHRLRYYVNRNLSSPKQFGSMKTTSTSSTLKPITNFIFDNTNHKKVVCVWKTDVEGAFENISTYSILDILKPHIPGDLWFLIKDLLSNRSVYYKPTSDSDSPSVQFKKTTGTTQGSTLSPILFSAVMSVLHNELDTKLANSEWNDLTMIGPFSYADDFFGAFVTSTRLPHLDSFLSFLKFSFNSILKPWDLKLADDKSICSLLPYPVSPPLLTHSKFSIENKVTILGVTFGLFKGSIFGTHIEAKYKEIYTQIENYKNNSFNQPPYVKKMIAENILIPKLLYQAEVWANYIGQHQIDRVNSAMRIISIFSIGGTKSTSFLAASALSGIFPGFIWIKELALLANIRSHGIVVNGSVRILQSRIDPLAFFHPATTPMPDLIITDYICEDELPKEDPQHLQLYTDASWSSTGGGMAIISILARRELLLKTHNLTNNHELELMAIRIAFWIAEDFALVNKKALKEITVLTDSLSAITQIKNQSSDNETVLLIRNSINYHKKWGRKLNLIWVRGHDDYYGNIRADHLAKQAASIGTEFEVNIPISVIKKLLKSQSREWWTSWCRNQLSNSTHLKRIFCEDSFPPSLPIHPDWAVTGLITSHSFRLNEYKARIIKSPGVSGKCPCDNETMQDGIHVIFDCPLLGPARTKICEQLEWDMEKIDIRHVKALTKDQKFYQFLSKLGHCMQAYWPQEK